MLFQYKQYKYDSRNGSLIIQNIIAQNHTDINIHIHFDYKCLCQCCYVRMMKLPSSLYCLHCLYEIDISHSYNYLIFCKNVLFAYTYTLYLPHFSIHYSLITYKVSIIMYILYMYSTYHISSSTIVQKITTYWKAKCSSLLSHIYYNNRFIYR